MRKDRSQKIRGGNTIWQIGEIQEVRDRTSAMSFFTLKIKIGSSKALCNFNPKWWNRGLTERGGNKGTHPKYLILVLQS